MPNLANKATWHIADLNWQEWHIQAAIVLELKRHPQYDLRFTFAGDQNAGKRGPKAASIAKATGMMAGEPDIRFYCHNGRMFFVELKRAKGKLTAGQKERHELLENLGFTCYTVTATCPADGIKQVMKILEGELDG